MSGRLTTVTVCVLACWSAAACGGDERPRARDLGIEIGIFPPREMERHNRRFGRAGGPCHGG